MSDLTPETIAELKRLEQAATKGPWEILNLADYWEIVEKGNGYDACHNLFDEDWSLNAKDNAELLAALRNAAKPLIAAAEECERLRERVRELEAGDKYTSEKLERAERKIGELIAESGSGANADYWDYNEDRRN